FGAVCQRSYTLPSPPTASASSRPSALRPSATARTSRPPKSVHDDQPPLGEVCQRSYTLPSPPTVMASSRPSALVVTASRDARIDAGSGTGLPTAALSAWNAVYEPVAGAVPHVFCATTRRSAHMPPAIWSSFWNSGSSHQMLNCAPSRLALYAGLIVRLVSNIEMFHRSYSALVAGRPRPRRST